MNKRIFVIAVSGGIDSITLLHMLHSKQNDVVHYIVAHFDHGIRSDSADDARFVETLASHYDMPFVLGEGKLGAGASEDSARAARYGFLRRVASAYGAEKILTAHHQDDLLETMILNILRGTSPRGLAPMQGQPDLLRPLLKKSKAEILEYAIEHNLEWREDSTNSDESYKRNYVRKNIMPKLSSVRDELLKINKRIDELYEDIDWRIKSMTPSMQVLSRSVLAQLPFRIRLELLRAWLIKYGVSDLSSAQIERLCIAALTLPAGKRVDVDGKFWLVSEQKVILLLKK